MHTRSCYKWKECCWSYCYILKCLSRSISVADWLPYFCLHPMVPSKESSSIVHTQKKCFLPLRWLTLTWVKVILSVCGSIFNSFNTVKLIRTNVTFTSQWASTISSSDWSDLIWSDWLLPCDAWEFRKSMVFGTKAFCGYKDSSTLIPQTILLQDSSLLYSASLPGLDSNIGSSCGYNSEYRRTSYTISITFLYCN